MARMMGWKGGSVSHCLNWDLWDLGIGRIGDGRVEVVGVGILLVKGSRDWEGASTKIAMAARVRMCCCGSCAGVRNVNGTHEI